MVNGKKINWTYIIVAVLGVSGVGTGGYSLYGQQRGGADTAAAAATAAKLTTTVAAVQREMDARDIRISKTEDSVSELQQENASLTTEVAIIKGDVKDLKAGQVKARDERSKILQILIQIQHDSTARGRNP